MLRTLSLLLVALLSCIDSAGAETVQEAGLPNPAVVEIVFPLITFGRLECGVNFKTEIEIVNTTGRDAYVEFALFDQQGEVPALDYGNISWDGRYETCVDAGSIGQLDFPIGKPTRTRNFLGPYFVGWGILRSNQNVSAFQRIVVRDPVFNDVPLTARFWGVPKPIRRAEVPVLLPTQFNGSSTGIAIVNPSDSEDLILKVEYWDWVSNPLVDPPPELLRTLRFRFSPRSQYVLLVPNYSREDNNQSGFVRLIAAGKQTFAFTELYLSIHDEFGMSVRRPPTYDPAGDSQIHITSSGKWNFDVPIVQTTQLRDLEIVLTDFGFFVIDEARPSFDVTGSSFGDKFPGPFHLCGRTHVDVNEETGIAVVGGHREKSIVFGDSKKIIREVLLGNLNSIIDFPEQNRIEIFFGSLINFIGYPAWSGSHLHMVKKR